MKPVVAWAVRNSPSMNTMMIAIIVIGLGSGYLLRREEFPEFKMDMVAITVPYPGATPAQVEEGICSKIEEAIHSIDGIEKVLSVSNEGVGVVTATLYAHVDDPQRIVNDIRSAVDQIPSFPVLAEEPDIREVIGRLPAIHLAVLGPADESPSARWRLRQLGEEVRREVLDLPTVSLCEILAAPDYQIDVEISESTLRKYNLTLSDVADAIRRENVEMPAGTIRSETTEFLLRGTNRQLVGSEIAKFPVITQPNGVVLTVDDLGAVVDGFADATMVSYVDNRPCMSLQVDRTSEEDLLQITKEIRDFAAVRGMPEGYELVIWYDASVEVHSRLNLLYRSGLFGLMLVFLTLSLFLNIRLAFWVALGIPVSVMGTCAVLYIGDQTLNQLSMFAFVMALGIVVDDAIVIGENIFSHRQRGKSRVQAAVDGTAEVAPSVIASVMTTVVAFMPMFFVAGLMGKFIAIMPTVIISLLLFSLFESIFILPCHLGHTSFKTVTKFYDNLRKGVDRFIERIVHGFYAPTLRWLLKRPAVGFSASAATLIITAGLIQGGFTPFVLAPQVDADLVICNLAFPAGTPIRVTNAAAERIEDGIRELDAHYRSQGKPILEHVFRTCGGSMMQDPTRPGSVGTNFGSLFVKLVGAEERSGVTSRQILAEWRERVGEVAGAERVRYENMQVGPGGKPIEFKLQGDDPEVLATAVDEVKAKLANYTGVYDVGDGDEVGKWEFNLKILPRAQAMGITLDDLASTVRASYYGEEAMRIQRGRHEIKLMVRYPEADRRTLADFQELRVRAPDGSEIPLTELAEQNLKRQSSEIVRINQQRSITVEANLNEDVANAAEVVADLRTSFMPTLFKKYPGVSVRWEGQQEQTEESMTSLMNGFVVALFGIFMLLTLLFRSYAQPLIILAVIPFGLVGAVLGHLIMNMPLTIFTLFGVVALSGVVVNDSIVLIDFINKHREKGGALQEALVNAGCRRFRPVMLTSITTIAGLIPILVERSMQAQLLMPMATAISFGLAVATVWVLLLVPLMYQTYARFLEVMEPPDEKPVATDLHSPGDVLEAEGVTPSTMATQQAAAGEDGGVEESRTSQLQPPRI